MSQSIELFVYPVKDIAQAKGALPHAFGNRAVCG